MVVDTDPVQARQPVYRTREVFKIKRVWLGSFLGGLSAVVLVTLIGLLIGFTLRMLAMLAFGSSGDFMDMGSENPFLKGMIGAVFAALFNWYFFWISIPVTTLVLRFSLGQLARRGRVHSAPYWRWGAIWGAILVAAPSIFAGLMMTSDLGRPETNANLYIAAGIAGAVFMGAIIGAIAGLGVANVFRLVVRVPQQVQMVDPADAF